MENNNEEIFEDNTSENEFNEFEDNYEVEDSDDHIDESSLLTTETYDLPSNKDSFIDVKDGKMIEKADLSPFEIIKAVAEQTGTAIRNPRNSCKKCHGRGFMGTDFKTQMPIPCNCIYPTKTDVQKMNEMMYDNNRLGGKLNRDQRRRMDKFYKKHLKQLIRKKKEETANDN
jgi:hypothetical protein